MAICKIVDPYPKLSREEFFNKIKTNLALLGVEKSEYGKILKKRRKRSLLRIYNSASLF